MIQSHADLMHRYTPRHAVSLSPWILQPRTHDSEFGQLPSLSSRTLLWEGKIDKSVWEVQGRSVGVSVLCFFFVFFFFFCPKIQSQQYGLVYQCQDFILFAMLFVSHGQQISRKQSWKSWWSRRRKCRLSVRHHSFLASWDTVLLFLPERY